MSTIHWLKQAFEYLGGEVDDPPDGFPRMLTHPLFWGLWWGLLALAVMLFSGQTSKFIYIDF